MHSDSRVEVSRSSLEASLPSGRGTRRGFVDGPDGQIFYRETGSGPTIVLIHQILRSSLDYKFVMPILAERYHVVAFDNVGSGDSDASPSPYSLEDHAKAIAMAMDRLSIGNATVVGHHSGANVALELCLQRPDLVRSAVMSGLFYVEDSVQLRELHDKALKLADPQAKTDGSHLPLIWTEGLFTNWGKPRLPAERIDLLTDFFLEQMKAGARRFEPYVAQMHYKTSDRLPRLKAPCLFIKATDDVFMCSASDLWRRDQPGAKFTEIRVSGGGEMPRLYPQQWSAAILDFLV